MAAKLGDRIVRRKAGEVPKTSAADLARMMSIANEAIDTSDIPEQTANGDRLVRDKDGRLPKRDSMIRTTIAEAMAYRSMTVYALCKEARKYCPTISETAVGQFLKAQRSVGMDYIEAMFDALEIELSFFPKSASASPVVTKAKRVPG
jgi:hypothetical protein